MTFVRGALLVIAGLVATASAFAIPPDDPGPGELLPDFDQRAPSTVSIVRLGTGSPPTYALTFTARVENIGIGPLLLTGVRATAASPTMTVEQTILSSDGTSATRSVKGLMQYAEANHAHWHLAAFMRYELRNARTFALVRPDQKTGFCVGDRYRSPTNVPSRPPSPVMTEECGKRQPDALRVASGLSPGYGEVYGPIQDAQHIDVTGIATGRYVLVHRTNADRSLAELEYRNNAASALIEISPGADLPRVTVLATCEDSARCTAR